MASIIYETKASTHVKNPYFTDETNYLQIGYAGSYGTVNNIGVHDAIYFGLSFYNPTYLEQYPMIVPFELVDIYDEAASKWTYNYDWDISSYQHAIRGELSEFSESDIYFYIKAVKDDIEYIAWQKCFITIVNNTAPSIEDGPTVVITDSITKTYTGNDHTVIRYKSTANVQFKAAANKGSYLVGYQVKNGSKSVYSTSILKQDTAQISHDVLGASSGKFDVMVEDSRGFRTTASTSIDLIEYFHPTCHLDTVAISPSGGTTVVNVYGQCFNGNFGVQENNCTVYVQYRLIDSAYTQPWSANYRATVTRDGNNYTAKANISGFNYKKRYEFRAYVYDTLSTSIYSETIVGKSTPVFDWSDESFRFNVPVNVEAATTFNGVVDVNGNTTITGDLNVIGTITATDSGGDSNVGYFSGHWLPKINCISSPTYANGEYMRINDMCLINFYIEGTVTSTVDKVEITGLPFAPVTGIRWQSGGGHCNNYATLTTTSGSASSDVNRDQHRFTGWSIENGVLYGRTQDIKTGSPVTTSNPPYTKAWIIVDDNYYVGAVSGYTFYASGTLMYKILQ